MDDDLNPLQSRKLWLCPWIPTVLVVLILLGLTIFYAGKANSKACKDGLQAEQECRNFTHLLEHQLTQANKVLLDTEIWTATCNKTVVTLTTSLEMEKAQGHKQQELVQKLQGEVAELKQKLQDTSNELERLRKETETSDTGNGSTSFGNTINLFLVSVLLTLSLGALLA